jgi:hypothetical protein
MPALSSGRLTVSKDQRGTSTIRLRRPLAAWRRSPDPKHLSAAGDACAALEAELARLEGCPTPMVGGL